MEIETQPVESHAIEEACKEGEFNYESVQDRESILGYLRALIDGIESGRLQLSIGNNSLTLHPDGLMDFEVNAKRKGSRVKLGLRMSWREQPDFSDSLRIFSP